MTSGSADAPQDITVDLPQGLKPWDYIAAHFIDCILDGVECQARLRRGLIVQGTGDSAIRILPPLSINKVQLEIGLTVFDEAVATVEA